MERVRGENKFVLVPLPDDKCPLLTRLILCYYSPMALLKTVLFCDDLDSILQSALNK